MTTRIRRSARPFALLAAVLAFGARAETVTYYATDHLGSPVAAMDGDGNVLWRESYTPYGEKRENPSDADNDTGYTGHQSDEITGLTYMQARYYDPVVGRFMAADPVWFAPSNPASFSRYLYANSNPYKFRDPDGQVAVAIALPELAPLCAGPQATACVIVGVGAVASVGFYYGAKWLGNAVFADSTEDAVDKLSDGKKPAEGKEGEKGVLVGNGGRDEAESDFDGIDGEEIDTGKEGTRVKNLEDGGRVEIHDSSGKGGTSEPGTRTIKVQDDKGKTIRTIRYPEQMK